MQKAVFQERSRQAITTRLEVYPAHKRDQRFLTHLRMAPVFPFSDASGH